MLEIIAPTWHVKAETARQQHLRLRAVLEWAVAMEFRIDNPCDRIGPVLGPQHDVVQHMRALPHRDVAAAIRTVRATTAAPAVRLAFEFLELTAARTLDDGASALVFTSRRRKPLDESSCAGCYASMRSWPYHTVSDRASVTGRPRRRIIPER